MGKKCTAVREAMVPVHVIELDTSLFEAVALIAKHDCVLVKDEANKICGVMTSYDVSETFVELGEPFLLLGEIENLIRDMMEGRFSEEGLEKGRDRSMLLVRSQRCPTSTSGAMFEFCRTLRHGKILERTWTAEFSFRIWSGLGKFAMTQCTLIQME